jgi:O-antigen ligase
MFAVAAIAAIGSLMLILTQSRGGYLGFGASLMAIGLLSGQRSRILTLAGLTVLALLMMVTPPGRSAAQRFTSSVAVFNSRQEVTIENWSVQERVAHWRAGLHMLRDKPWTGVGAGNFNQRYREYTQVWRFRIPRGHAHNNEIQMGAQSGYTGLIAYLALLFTVGVRILRGMRGATQTSARALAIGAFGVFIAVLVHGQFDYLHGLSLSIAFALALACAEPAAATAVAARERMTAS